MLSALGLPAASQVTLEVGVFAAATALAGRLAPASLAAHQIAVNLAAFTFMVPLGVASAGAVRVGHAVGRRDPPAAARAGWTALLFGAFFMACAAATFLFVPRQLIGAFTPDRAVIEIGVSLLFVGAIFQMFDGVQGSPPASCAASGTPGADAVEPCGALVHRTAARIRALFPRRLLASSASGGDCRPASSSAAWRYSSSGPAASAGSSTDGVTAQDRAPGLLLAGRRNHG